MGHLNWLDAFLGFNTLWGLWAFFKQMALLIRRDSMGIQMTELASGEAHAEFVWGQGVVHFTFDPNAYTAQAESEWKEISETSWAGDMAIAYITKLVTSWDLMGDVEFSMRPPTPDELDEDPDAPPQRIPGTGRIVEADHAFPLNDPDKLRYIPMPLTGEIVNAIQDALIVGKAKRRRSGGGSGTAEIHQIRR